MIHGMSPSVVPHSTKSPGTRITHEEAQIMTWSRHDRRSGEAYWLHPFMGFIWLSRGRKLPTFLNPADLSSVSSRSPHESERWWRPITSSSSRSKILPATRSEEHTSELQSH